MKLFSSVMIFLLSVSLHANSTSTVAKQQSELVPQSESFVENLIQAATYFNWGKGQNGWGYCYEWTKQGYVLHGGQPQPNYYCEQVRPSYFYWGQGQNGWGYCYQYTPYGVAMNEGRPQSNYYCEQKYPSFYRWGKGQNGYTYCYQVTANGYFMNDGQPVSDYHCRY